MTTMVIDIAKGIRIGFSDSELNIIIQDYLNDKYYTGTPTTVSQWRIDHYKQLRKWSWPEVGEYLDAQVKIGSEIGELIAQGQQQLEAYNQTCLNVKARFPKE